MKNTLPKWTTMTRTIKPHHDGIPNTLSAAATPLRASGYHTNMYPVMGKQEQRCGDDGSQGRGGLNDLCWEAIQISARFVNSATHLTRLARRGQ